MKTYFNFVVLLTWIFSSIALAKGTEARFVISIIDTGIDLKNENLKKHLCTNAGEIGQDKNGQNKANNGIDDDGNGFADDIHGWSFFDDSKDIQDHHGHGTHIAGILLKELQTLKLESKFCFQILKYYDSDEPFTHLLKASNDSFKYALENHAQLVNYSGGGYSPNKEEAKWIQELASKRVPIVAAMGNQKLNTDSHPFYPASYDSENLFAIGAADNHQNVASFSNFGKKRFDFLAPGVSIESFGLNNSRTFLSGTSQATAKISALIAYLIYQETKITDWKKLKSNLKSLRALYTNKKQNENPTFVDTPYIQKFKTSAVDAFGDP